MNLGYDPWQRCKATPGEAPAAAFCAEGTAFTFLCPSFFQQPLSPSGNKCPSVVTNLFSGDVYDFYRNYQVYTLFYTFIRFYLGALSLDSHSDPKETFDWNWSINLPLLASTKNPTNYVLFAALIAQGCDEIPDPGKPPFSSGLSLASFNASTSLVADD